MTGRFQLGGLPQIDVSDLNIRGSEKFTSERAQTSTNGVVMKDNG